MNNADGILLELRRAVDEVPINHERVVRLVKELDDWLSDGGEMPQDWKQYTVDR